MARDGITYNSALGRYDTPWGWIRLDWKTGAVEVSGPQAERWFDAARAQHTAELFARFTVNPGMAVALAIHGQYSAWLGNQQLLNVFRRTL